MIGVIESKIFISVLPEDKAKEAFGVLNRQIYDIQQKLNKILYMRPIPKIIFVEDTEGDQAIRIEKILEKIKEE